MIILRFAENEQAPGAKAPGALLSLRHILLL